MKRNSVVALILVVAAPALFASAASCQQGQRGYGKAYSLLVAADTASPPLPTDLFDGPIGGARHTSRECSVMLPSFPGAGRDLESFISLTSPGGTAVSLRVFVVDASEIERVNRSAGVYAAATVAAGSNFVLVDEAAVLNQFAGGMASPSSAAGVTAAATTSNDQGEGSTILDSGVTVNTKSVCFRPYVPFTRQASGIVHWAIDNPRVFFSLKDENSGNNSASSLRCPSKHNGDTDYYVDGVYNILWFSTRSAKALKIPDHCSVVKNSQGFATCCNSALIPLYGTVRFINPRDPSLPDWPDNPRVCSNSDP